LKVIANFLVWYAKHGLKYQDTNKNTPADTIGQNVKVLVKKAGTGPDFTVGSDSKRPTIGTEGNLIGDGVDDHLISGNLDLSGNYTLVLRFKTAGGNTGYSYFGASVGANAFAFRSNDGTIDYYNNASGSSVIVASTGTFTSRYVTIAISVASGVATLHKPDGTTISGGATSQSATSVLSILSGYGGENSTAQSTTPWEHSLLYLRALTVNEIALIREYLAA
jgi:hypothetical protein